MRVTPLNAAAEEPPIVAQVVEFQAGAAMSESSAMHETTGLVYVLEGRMQIDAGGMHEVLETGDCAYMDSEMALSWSAVGKHRCRILSVTPQPSRR